MPLDRALRCALTLPLVLLLSACPRPNTPGEPASPTDPAGTDKRPRMGTSSGNVPTDPAMRMPSDPRDPLNTTTGSPSTSNPVGTGMRAPADPGGAGGIGR